MRMAAQEEERDYLVALEPAVLSETVSGRVALLVVRDLLEAQHQAELTGREPRSILQTMLARVAGEAQALQPLLSQVQAAQGEVPEQRRI